MAPSRGGKRGKMNEDHSTEGKPANKLWTRDFTIITLGSVVSMVGGTMTGFAISIMVLDYTGSTFLYALFNICFQIPMLVCPLLAGPVLDLSLIHICSSAMGERRKRSSSQTGMAAAWAGVSRCRSVSLASCPATSKSRKSRY